MEDRVFKRLPVDANQQLGHADEIRLAQSPGRMLLQNPPLPARPFLRPPNFDPALKGPQLAVCKFHRLIPLEIGKKRLGFQSHIVFEKRFGFRPGIGKRVLPCQPVAMTLRHDLTWHSIQVPILAGDPLIPSGLPLGHFQRFPLT